MCVNCIRGDVDITDGIPKQTTLHFCRGCDRYLQPPGIWVKAELESRELMALCLKRLKGLAKVRLTDAKFIWTEPHSKRVKVKLVIQKEVYASTILQQEFVVEYVVAGQYCEECARVDAQLTWKAVVQIRQKVPHKRTFLWLEQLILKHNAHRDTTNIKEFKDGLDFFYVQRAHAVKMVEFLQAVVPIKMKTSEELISQDIHSGTANYKFTYSIEIIPICKDDLVCLTPKLARQLSNTNPLVICSRVSNVLNFIDPNTLKVVDLRPSDYWIAPFAALCEQKELVEFYVIDVQYEQIQTHKYRMATVEVTRSNDMSRTFLVRTHLGHILHPGDHALGYDLTNTNFNNSAWDNLTQSSARGSIPDVVLVKKSYPYARKKTRGRAWKLKGMAKEEEVEAFGRGGRTEKAQREMDYERFLQDIEEDPELRGMINLYKDPNAKAKAKAEEEDAMMDEEEEPEEDFPQIKMDELLDDMENMTIHDEEMEG
ncbi:hypothetical protein HK104_004313 [Borealophlyctis nickersoniae]|nr:hypothetical protein HK104_004313 [Borealophlyctis nickersoniae]